MNKNGRWRNKENEHVGRETKKTNLFEIKMRQKSKLFGVKNDNFSVFFHLFCIQYKV